MKYFRLVRSLRLGSRLVGVLCFLCACALTSRAAYVSFTFTNSVGSADTNKFKLYPVSGPVANADGSFTTIGVPISVTPSGDGKATNYLAANNYVVSNSVLASGIAFRVPQDTSAHVYSMWDLRISGFNYFVNTYVYTNDNGATQTPLVQDVDGAGYSITNLGTVSAGSFTGSGGGLTNLGSVVGTHVGDDWVTQSNAAFAMGYNASTNTFWWNVQQSDEMFFPGAIRAGSGFVGDGVALTNLNPQVALGSNNWYLATNSVAGTALTNNDSRLLSLNRVTVTNGLFATNKLVVSTPGVTNSTVVITNGGIFLPSNLYGESANYWAGELDWAFHGQDLPPNFDTTKPLARLTTYQNWASSTTPDYSPWMLMTCANIRLEEGWQANNHGIVYLGNEHSYGNVDLNYAPGISYLTNINVTANYNGLSHPLGFLVAGTGPATNAYYAHPGIVGMAAGTNTSRTYNGQYAGELVFASLLPDQSQYGYYLNVGAGYALTNVVAKMHTNSWETFGDNVVSGGGRFIGNASGATNIPASAITNASSINLTNAIASGLTLTGITTNSGGWSGPLAMTNAATGNWIVLSNGNANVAGNITNSGYLSTGTNYATKLRVGGAAESSDTVNVTGTVSVSSTITANSGFSSGSGAVYRWFPNATANGGFLCSIWNGSAFVQQAAIGSNSVFNGNVHVTNNIISTSGQFIGNGGGLTNLSLSSQTILSNAVSTWPTAPSAAGAAYIGNSNGVIYLLTSGAGATWSATNKLAP